ncbi:MAG TPA: hypothetical protein VFV33_13125 [Gemmatimonadaceae bacterium]|nr:hypothetical protein [Gemmatimonadaceae bacterium]
MYQRLRPFVGALLVLMTLTPGAGAQAPQARAMLPGIDVPIMLDTMALEFPIAGPRDSIYAALTKVFQELRIPVQTANPKAGLLNNLNADISRRLGGEPVSRYLDCGRGFSGNNADYYRITLAVSAWVEPATGEPRKLMVAIAASGRDPSGTRSYYSQCTSRGDLEKRIARRVQEIVGPG